MRKYSGNKPRARLNYETRKMIKTNGVTNYDSDKENSDFYIQLYEFRSYRVIKQRMTKGKCRERERQTNTRENYTVTFI